MVEDRKLSLRAPWRTGHQHSACRSEKNWCGGAQAIGKMGFRAFCRCESVLNHASLLAICQGQKERCLGGWHLQRDLGYTLYLLMGPNCYPTVPTCIGGLTHREQAFPLPCVFTVGSEPLYTQAFYSLAAGATRMTSTS